MTRHTIHGHEPTAAQTPMQAALAEEARITEGMSAPADAANGTQRLTVRERMEAIGWFLSICEDTCAAEWMKLRGRTVTAYASCDRVHWQRDLDACQKAYGYDEGESYYD